MIKFAINKGRTTPPRGFVGIMPDESGNMVQIDSSGAVTPLTGGGSVSAPASVNWADIVGKPTQYPVAPHGHATSEFTGMGQGGGASAAWADIPGKPATFPPETHSHGIADVTGLQSAQPAARRRAAAITRCKSAVRRVT